MSFQYQYQTGNAKKTRFMCLTEGYHGLGCSAALAVINILREDAVLENAEKRARYLNSKLNEALLDHKNIGEIRHIGLINALELVSSKNDKTDFDPKLRIGYQIYKRALEKGLILRPLGNVLYFNPPLIINEAEIDKAVGICAQAICSIIGG